MNLASFLEELPIEQRLALAYCPARARPQHLALFALDRRLCTIVAGSREPLLAQLKLAWWRDELAKPSASRARGEPLLALIESWGAQSGALSGLVDGWEAMLSDPGDSPQALATLVQTRAEAFADLADVVGQARLSASARQAAHGWALADISAWDHAETDRAHLSPLIAGHDWAPIRLPRALRPLQVLYGLARRSKGEGAMLAGPGSGLAAIRLGLFGR